MYFDSNKNPDKSYFAALLQKYDIEKAIVSSVQKDYGNTDEALQAFNLDTKLELHILSCESLLPIKNNYKTPKTLGKDRVAALVGAYSLYPNMPVLVIDAGTAITIDYLDENGVFYGRKYIPGYSNPI